MVVCKWGTTKEIHVIRRNNPYIEDGWHPKPVDACIADYVQAMNDRGIITLGCCCGHGDYEPSVVVSVESTDLMNQYAYDYKHITAGCIEDTDMLYHVIPDSGRDLTIP